MQVIRTAEQHAINIPAAQTCSSEVKSLTLRRGRPVAGLAQV